MLALLIIAGYLLIAGFAWRRFAIAELESIGERWPNYPISSSDRSFAAWTGAGLPLIWPLALVHRFLSRRIRNSNILRTPKEIAAADRAELESLRELARLHDLPIPGEER